MAKRANRAKSKVVPRKGKSIAKEREEKEEKQEKGQSEQQAEEGKKAEHADKYSLKLQDGEWQLQLHSKYRIAPENTLHSRVDKLYSLFLQKQKRRDCKGHQLIPYSYFPSFQLALRGEEHKDDKCSICQFQFQQHPDFEEQLVKDSQKDIITFQCSHLMHIGCFHMLRDKKDWVRCPVCFTIYGVMTGDQPDGQMTWTVNQFMHCDGYPDVGTICIDYSMQSTVRKGTRYQGTHRHAYLPDNPQGREVLALLHEAFKRRLIFTLGRSVTTGRDNQVVWNGVHHKTNLEGGSAYFGFPDPTYFDRVKLQLAMKGVK